ncbi:MULTISPECIES: CapA family protein [unclassified Sedimentibacter]|uniref:CapA family protein n=1 Tax=unclassified Sedimentibacter TaxID=2649220 RepID=UPI0027E04377|nr:CapA family protein [Sedimentibacter sp. MB35-C1]WMJ76400.1 CapA family protein [Sedimentibacter sp. MB35-C1]
MSRKYRRRKKRIRLLSLGLFVIVSILAASFVVNGMGKDSKGKNDIGEADFEDVTNVSQPEIPIEPVAKPNVTINLKATGDIMFHPSQLDGAYDSKTGKYDFKNSFKAVKGLFQSADLAIANFEGTTAGDSVYAYQGYPIFNAPDEVLDAIKDAGFDVLSTANNHSLDTRKAGVIRTVNEISARGMDPIGTYTEKPETRVLIKEIKGIKLAFLSYTEMVNGLESVMSSADLDAMINIIDETKISEDIVYAKSQNADVIIACMHWGDEYSRFQAERQEVLADKMFEEGVDIILGSHPHVIQPAQKLEYGGKTKFVAYSMGNFLSNQRVETLLPYGLSEEVSKYTEDGVIVDINIEKNGETGEVNIKEITYIPLWVYKGTTDGGGTEHVVYPIMEYIESSELNENTKIRMKRSLSDTSKQMQLLESNTVE